MPVVDVVDETDLQQRLLDAGPNLVLVRMTTSWCETCKGFVSFYDDLSMKYPNAHFLNFDVEKHESSVSVLQGLHEHRNGMPVFALFKNKKQLERVEVGSRGALEVKIFSHYSDKDSSDVKGMVLLNPFISEEKSECLNESDEHPFRQCLYYPDEDSAYLESDCDEQLILSIAFTQAVKIHSINIKAPSDIGPKNIRLFINQPKTISFDDAESIIAVQDICLSQKQLDGSPIALKFVKFQNVQNLQVFFKDNQERTDVTKIHFFGIIGAPIGTTDIDGLKRASGKKGAIH